MTGESPIVTMDGMVSVYSPRAPNTWRRNSTNPRASWTTILGVTVCQPSGCLGMFTAPPGIVTQQAREDPARGPRPRTGWTTLSGDLYSNRPGARAAPAILLVCDDDR